MTLDIRTATGDDHRWVVAEHGRIYPSEFGFHDDFVRDIADKMEAFIAKDDAFKRLWIAVSDGGRVGSVAISRVAKDTAFLNFVLVDEKCRGRGVASALMRTAISHARDHQVVRIRLETYSLLEDARELYTRLGFRITDRTVGVRKYGRTFAREFWEMPL